MIENQYLFPEAMQRGVCFESDSCSAGCLTSSYDEEWQIIDIVLLVKTAYHCYLFVTSDRPCKVIIFGQRA